MLLLCPACVAFQHSARRIATDALVDDFLRSVVRRGQARCVLMFDVGANDGSWSESMWAHVVKAAPTARAQLHILEPQPQFAKRLARLANKSTATRQVVFVPAAAHVEKTRLTFFFGARSSTGASLVQSNNAGKNGSVTVDAIDLARYLCDAVVNTHCYRHKPLGFLKVDVEAAEYALLPHLLRHAGRTLCRSFSHILVEWHLDYAGGLAKQRQGLALQKQLNETLRRTCGDGGLPVPLLAHDDWPPANTFAARDGEAAAAMSAPLGFEVGDTCAREHRWGAWEPPPSPPPGLLPPPPPPFACAGDHGSSGECRWYVNGSFTWNDSPPCAPGRSRCAAYRKANPQGAPFRATPKTAPSGARLVPHHREVALNAPYAARAVSPAPPTRMASAVPVAVAVEAAPIKPVTAVAVTAVAVAADRLDSPSSADEMGRVRQLLHKLKLPHYASAFEAAGYNDVDFLLQLDVDGARRVGRDVGMKLDEALRLLGTVAPTTAAPTTAAPTTAAPTTAAPTTTAASTTTPHEIERVRQLLSELKLEKYASAFIENGYDDADFLKQLSADDARRVAEAVGMMPGHAHKFVISVNTGPRA